MQPEPFPDRHAPWTYTTDDPAKAELAMRVLVRRGCPYIEMQTHPGDDGTTLYHVSFHREERAAVLAHRAAIARMLGAGRIVSRGTPGQYMQSLMHELADFSDQVQQLERRRESVRRTAEMAQVLVDAQANALEQAGTQPASIQEALNSGNGTYKP